jgi:hypothetical protein
MRGAQVDGLGADDGDRIEMGPERCEAVQEDTTGDNS